MNSCWILCGSNLLLLHGNPAGSSLHQQTICMASDPLLPARWPVTISRESRCNGRAVPWLPGDVLNVVAVYEVGQWIYGSRKVSWSRAFSVYAKEQQWLRRRMHGKERFGCRGVVVQFRRGNDVLAQEGGQWPSTPFLLKRLQVDTLLGILNRNCRDGFRDEALYQLDFRIETYHVKLIVRLHDDVKVALSFFNWARALPGYRHDSWTYTLMLRRLGDERLFELMGDQLEQMISDACKISDFTVTTVLAKFGKGGRINSSVNAFRRFHDAGFKHNLVTYNCIIGLLVKGGYDIQEVQRLFYEMEREGCLPNVNTYNMLIKGLVKAGCLDEACKVFETMSVEQRLKSAVDLSFLAKLGCTLILPDESAKALSYADLIDLVREAGKICEAELLAAKLEEMTVVPDVITYSVLIDALCKAGKLDKACTLFLQMKKEGYGPNVFTYSAIISGLTKAQRWAAAEQYFDEMQAEGCTPNVVTYTIVIDGLGRKGDVDKAAELIREMKSKGCLPNVVTYTSHISSLFKAGRMDLAWKTFEDMKKEHQGPNVNTYNVLINGLLQAEQFDEALKLCREMCKTGVVPDLVTHNSLISGFGKAGRITEALALFDQMKGMGPAPDAFTYTAMTHLLGKAERIKEAHDLFLQMKEMGFIPDVVCYSTLIDMFGKTGQVEEAYKFFYEMRQSGCEPNVITYTCMLDAFGKAGYVSEVVGLFEKMLQEGLVPDLLSFNVLLDAHCNAGDVDEALKVFGDMQKLGSGPDLIAYSTVIKGLAKVGRMAEAARLFEKMKQKHITGNPQADETSCLTC